MALDRFALDAARKLQNLPPLTDDEFASLNGNGFSEEEKKAQIDAEVKKKADAEAERIRLEEEQKGDKKPEDEPKVRELTEDEILKIVSEKTGKPVTSWADLKAKEEVDEEKKKEERDAEKLSWGLKNKKIKAAELENYSADSKDAKSLVYRLRLQEAKKEDAALDEKEFEEEFNEEFGINAPKDSRRYKNGQNTLNRLASAVLQSTYSSIYSLDNEFSQFEKQQQQQQVVAQKVRDGAPAYSKALGVVKSQLKKIKASLSDAEEYEVDVLDESIDEAVSLMSDPKWAAEKIVNGYTEEELKDVAWTIVLKKNWPLFADQIATQRLYKKAAGTKGIPSLGMPANEVKEELSPEWQKMAAIIEQNKTKEPAPAAAN